VVQLVSPEVRYKASFLAGVAAFKAEGLPWFQEVDPEWIGANFEAFVKGELAATTRGVDPVPQTNLWGIVEGRYAGRISIRHQLNDALRVMGGHVGYDTVPEFRRRGVGTEMLALALPIARSLGLERVLLTCDDTNLASIRIIERNGGVLERKAQIAEDRPLKRYYWIAL
jgi:predicted acetyltransferase